MMGTPTKERKDWGKFADGIVVHFNRTRMLQFIDEYERKIAPKCPRLIFFPSLVRKFKERLKE